MASSTPPHTRKGGAPPDDTPAAGGAAKPAAPLPGAGERSRPASPPPPGARRPDDALPPLHPAQAATPAAPGGLTAPRPEPDRLHHLDIDLIAETRTLDINRLGSPGGMPFLKLYVPDPEGGDPSGWRVLALSLVAGQRIGDMAARLRLDFHLEQAVRGLDAAAAGSDAPQTTGRGTSRR